jgi:ABC-type nitrate/sulfonate/bicarbonate transport system ATPase subunit
MPTERPGVTPAKISLKGVRKGFPTDKGRLEVIDNLEFDVAGGEFVAIVGPSGCGKTTLMNIIAGFLAPDAGGVHVDGKLRDGPSPKGIMITQQGSVFPWLTVRQNLLFGLPDGLPDREALAADYAELVGLKGFDNHYPHELSGGMLKRAEIARALVVKPEILYMDEPFSALDALMSLRMQNELLRILAKEKHTVLLITHDVEEAIHLADRVLVLSPRPTRIKAEFHVPFAHPRKVSSPEAQALRVAILRELGVELV